MQLSTASDPMALPSGLPIREDHLSGGSQPIGHQLSPAAYSHGRHQDPQELELQLCATLWVLGTEPESFGRGAPEVDFFFLACLLVFNVVRIPEVFKNSQKIGKEEKTNLWKQNKRKPIDPGAPCCLQQTFQDIGVLGRTYRKQSDKISSSEKHISVRHVLPSQNSERGRRFENSKPGLHSKPKVKNQQIQVSGLKNLLHTQHTVENKKKGRPMSSSSPCIEDRKGILKAAEQDSL